MAIKYLLICAALSWGSSRILPTLDMRWMSCEGDGLEDLNVSFRQDQSFTGFRSRVSLGGGGDVIITQF